MKKILSPVRRAVEDYQMIQSGDRICVGVSGGKDSVLLLAALKQLSRFYPKPFSVFGVTIDTGAPDMDFTPVRQFCEREQIEYVVRKTDIYDIVFDVRKESNPCSLCSVMRKGALNTAAVELGANKVALGHNYDDVLETFFMNLIHEGRIGCFRPVTDLSRTGLCVIRPLIYMTENSVRAGVKRCGLPIVVNTCPANGHTQRQETKELLDLLEQHYDGMKKRVFGALRRADIDGWGTEAPRRSRKIK